MPPPAGGHAVHPQNLTARLIRAARGLRSVRGWTRLGGFLVPPTRTGAFTVANRGLWFTGDLGVTIDRAVYLNGGYEDESIDLFLSRVSPNRRGVILDVGANAGTHSLRFSDVFETVHAFDPNPQLWAQFETNMALNRRANVTLHWIGLGRQAADAPLFAPTHENAGLATFSDSPQYDRPLREIAIARIVNGADYLAALGVTRVDAIKIDVQGFEADVLEGLRPVLERDRPLTWVEAGGEAGDAIHTKAALQRFFPYRIKVERIRGVRGLLRHRWRLEPAEETLPSGDYLVTAID